MIENVGKHFVLAIALLTQISLHALCPESEIFGPQIPFLVDKACKMQNFTKGACDRLRLALQRLHASRKNSLLCR